MNKWDEPNLETDIIADAVRTYPLAPVPPSMAVAIMRQIRRTNSVPRFQLQWIDLALGLFGASMTALAWLLFQWWQGLPDGENTLLANTLASVDPLDILLGAAGVVGGLLVVGLCLILALLVLAPGPSIRFQPVLPQTQPRNS